MGSESGRELPAGDDKFARLGLGTFAASRIEAPLANLVAKEEGPRRRPAVEPA